MAPENVNFRPRAGQPTRRHVLRAVAATLAAGSFAATGAATEIPTSQPLPGATPWWLQPPHSRSRVVDVRSSHAFRGAAVDTDALERMLARGATALTGVAEPAAAWRAILGNARRIVLKFNRVGAEVIGTTGAMARALVGALTGARYDRSQIGLVEAPSYLAAELGTSDPPAGWGPCISVGDRMEPLAEYVCQADAIINIPFLKTHQIAGMSACLKNLSHAVIRSPALYHDNGCAPYVGQVVSNKQVSSRLRLSVVNALRLVVRNGPDATEADLCPHGGILLGFDPVALDALGHALLSTARRRMGFAQLAEIRYLSSAIGLGVGRAGLHEVEQIALDDDA